MSWYKCSNGRITERRLQNNVRSPSYDNYDSLVILVSPIPFAVLSPRLLSSPTPTIQLQQGLAYFSMTRHVGWTPRIIYSISTFDFSAKRSLKTHALMTKDFYLWHGNSNNFHMPCSLSYFTYLRYVPNSIELCHGFIECHTWRWYWLGVIVKRPKWRSLPRWNGCFKRIHVKLYAI